MRVSRKIETVRILHFQSRLYTKVSLPTLSGIYPTGTSKIDPQTLKFIAILAPIFEIISINLSRSS